MTAVTRTLPAPERPAMRLFSADLYRNFAIGFAVGAVLVGAQASAASWDSLVPAIAAILPL